LCSFDTTLPEYRLALHVTVVVYTVLTVYVLHRYRFAQGTVVPGNLQAYSLRMHRLLLLIVIYNQ
jgi:hypothetical protein